MPPAGAAPLTASRIVLTLSVPVSIGTSIATLVSPGTAQDVVGFESLGSIGALGSPLLGNNSRPKLIFERTFWTDSAAVKACLISPHLVEALAAEDFWFMLPDSSITINMLGVFSNCPTVSAAQV